MFGGSYDTGEMQLEESSVSGSLPTLKMTFAKVGRPRTCGLKLEMKEGGPCNKSYLSGALLPRRKLSYAQQHMLSLRFYNNMAYIF